MYLKWHSKSRAIRQNEKLTDPWHLSECRVSSTNWSERARQHCLSTARKVIHSLLVLSFSHSAIEIKYISHNVNLYSFSPSPLRTTLSKLLSDQQHQHQSLSRCSLWQLSSTSIVYHVITNPDPCTFNNVSIRLNRFLEILRQVLRVLYRDWNRYNLGKLGKLMLDTIFYTRWWKCDNCSALFLTRIGYTRIGAQ